MVSLRKDPKLDDLFKITHITGEKRAILRWSLGSLFLVTLGCALFFASGFAQTIVIVALLCCGFTVAAFKSRSDDTKALWAIVAVPAWILLLCVVIGVPDANVRARRSKCRNNLTQISQAMKIYASRHHSPVPVASYDSRGRVMHSWRALILPHLDSEWAARYRYDEPWDGPHNRLLNETPDVFLCLDDSSGAKRGCTSYLAVIDQRPAATRANRGGSVRTIVEVHGSNVQWREPTDVIEVKLGEGTRRIPQVGMHNQSHHVLREGKIDSVNVHGRVWYSLSSSPEIVTTSGH